MIINSKDFREIEDSLWPDVENFLKQKAEELKPLLLNNQLNLEDGSVAPVTDVKVELDVFSGIPYILCKCGDYYYLLSGHRYCP